MVTTAPSRLSWIEYLDTRTYRVTTTLRKSGWGIESEDRVKTYPRPYPSRTTGANPPNSTAGLPSVDVESIL